MTQQEVKKAMRINLPMSNEVDLTPVKVPGGGDTNTGNIKNVPVTPKPNEVPGGQQPLPKISPAGDKGGKK